MRTRIAVVLFCLLCLCAPQAGLYHRQNPAEEIMLNCALLTAGDKSESNKIYHAISLAEIYLETGQKAKAFETLSQAVEKTGLKDPQALGESLIADLLTPVASLYARAGQPDRAINLANKIERTSARAEALARIASALIESGQTERVPGLLAQSLKLIKPADDARMAIDLIATAYAKIGDCDSALKAAEKIKPEYKHSKATTLSAIAGECAKAGRKDKAFLIISRALQTANSIKAEGISKEDDEGDLELKAEALTQIASVYIDLGEPDKAASILSRSTQIVKPLSINNFELESIAAAYAKAGRYPLAIETANSINYRPSQADALAKIAREHIKAGNKQAGIQVLTQAFEVVKRFKDSDDEFKMEILAEIAYDYVRAGDNQKASETLLYALKKTWAESEYAQQEMLVDIAMVYARTNLELDEEAKAILQKICAGEPMPLTPDELTKKQRAEETADRFIRRWHETLDLNVLFNEMYVTDPEQRRRNAFMFYGVYQFLTAAGEELVVEKDVDEKLMREGFMAFWNLYYSVEEYELAFGKSKDSDTPMPPEFLAARNEAMKVKLSDKKMSADPVRQYIAAVNHMSSLLRNHLKPEVFETDLYKQNLMKSLARHGKESERYRVGHGFPQFGVKENTELYVLKRGLFDFYFIEEKGELKVLTLGFEL